MRASFIDDFNHSGRQQNQGGLWWHQHVAQSSAKVLVDSYGFAFISVNWFLIIGKA